MKKIAFADALAHVKAVTPVYATRFVPLEAAAGKVLAEPLYAQYSVPLSPVSAMDGFAVCAAETKAAAENNPLVLTHFARVNTGNVVGEAFDAVIMIEDVEFDGSETPTEITIRSPIKAGRNVRATGEDIEGGRMVLPAGARLRAFDIGALAGYGITEAAVRSVSVGVIPTGTELVPVGTMPKAGEVVESNSIMTAAYLREFGVDVICYPPVADNQELIREAIEKAVSENEIVLLSAGSSMGAKDFTASAIADLGEVIFHGVRMKPAKPSMMGIVQGKPVIGMPGFPLAAQTTLRLFVRELLEDWGFAGPKQETLSAEAGCDIGSDEDIDEFRYAAAAEVNGRVVVLPQVRSASMQMNGIRSNGYIHIPQGTKEIKAGETVALILNVAADELKDTILLSGCYSAGSEQLVVRAAAEGIRVRFGDITSTDVSMLKTRGCHGVCVTEGADLSELDGIPVERFALGDGTMLLMRADADDSEASLLRRIAGGAA